MENETTIEETEPVVETPVVNEDPVIDPFYTEFITELKATLAYREIEIPADIVLKTEIDKAIGEINRCRRFTPTDENRYDIQYKNMIVPMCMFALSKVGVEGENSHSENGVQRIYVSDGEYPKELMNRIVPLIK